MRPAKKVEDSLTEQQYLLTPGHLNHYGRLFGGQLMMWIDEVAGIVARRHANSLITPAAVDNLQFKGPAYMEQVVVLVGKGHETYQEVRGVKLHLDEREEIAAYFEGK